MIKYIYEFVNNHRLTRAEPSRLTNNNFPYFLASSLVIRKYYCVLRLHRSKKMTCILHGRKEGAAIVFAVPGEF